MRFSVAELLVERFNLGGPQDQTDELINTEKQNNKTQDLDRMSFRE